MPIEQSHGKARPILPRASDLAPVLDAVPERRRQRDVLGRFAHGNVVGRGRGWKLAIAKVLGRAAEDPIACAVAADAWKLYAAALREMPDDGPTVRGLVALRARHEVLAAFWHHHAAVVGLVTPEGIAAQEQATKHGQRAERLAVTALDVASKLAAAKRARTDDNDDMPWLMPAEETAK